MRSALVFLCVLFSAAVAAADCPPDCLPGGGPSATDCFVEWGGITGPVTTCADGDACDMDGKIDGQCTFPLKACVNMNGSAMGCTASTLSSVKLGPKNLPAVQSLSTALAGIMADPETCTQPGFVVPLKISLAGVKKTTVKLHMTATSGGKKESDKLTFTCLPGNPSFANNVEPIFNGGTGGQHCATANACHNSTNSGTNPPNLDHGAAYGSIVRVKSSLVPPESRLPFVTPGNVAKSFLAHKILGQGLGRFGGAKMPQDCVIDGNCVTSGDVATILEWIQAGAPQN